jgi:hypothetical protein
VAEIQLRGAKAFGFETVEAWNAAMDAERAEREAAAEARAKSEAAKAERERAEAEAILDGGVDPELPPTPEPAAASPEAFHASTFEKAVEMLRSVMTKPLNTFAGAKVSRADLDQAARFLNEVARQRRAEAQPQKSEEERAEEREARRKEQEERVAAAKAKLHQWAHNLNAEKESGELPAWGKWRASQGDKPA